MHFLIRVLILRCTDLTTWKSKIYSALENQILKISLNLKIIDCCQRILKSHRGTGCWARGNTCKKRALQLYRWPIKIPTKPTNSQARRYKIASWKDGSMMSSKMQSSRTCLASSSALSTCSHWPDTASTRQPWKTWALITTGR